MFDPTTNYDSLPELVRARATQYRPQIDLPVGSGVMRSSASVDIGRVVPGMSVGSMKMLGITEEMTMEERTGRLCLFEVDVALITALHALAKGRPAFTDGPKSMPQFEPVGAQLDQGIFTEIGFRQELSDFQFGVMVTVVDWSEMPDHLHYTGAWGLLYHSKFTIGGNDDT